MKRIQYLLLYTIIVIGVSFIFRNNPKLDSILYISSAVIAIFIMLSLNISDKEKYRNLIKSGQLIESNETPINKTQNLSYVDIFTYVYLLIPIIISIFLFCK